MRARCAQVRRAEQVLRRGSPGLWGAATAFHLPLLTHCSGLSPPPKKKKQKKHPHRCLRTLPDLLVILTTVDDFRRFLGPEIKSVTGNSGMVDEVVVMLQACVEPVERVRWALG